MMHWARCNTPSLPALYLLSSLFFAQGSQGIFIPSSIPSSHPMPESIPIATTTEDVPPGEDTGSSPKSPKSQFSKHILVGQPPIAQMNIFNFQTVDHLSRPKWCRPRSASMGSSRRQVPWSHRSFTTPVSVETSKCHGSSRRQL